MNNTKKTSTHKQFSSSIGFIASAAGAAVGLGNIWKFPYEVGVGGGGAFLVIYLLLTGLLGYPLLLVKMALGRKVRDGVYAAYATEGHWKLLGWGTILVPFTVLSFYSVVTGWIILYILLMIFGPINQIDALAFSQITANVPANLLATGGVLLTTAWIVSAGVQQGLERISKILMPIFLCIILLLVAYALSLPEARAGIAFYLIPNLKAIHGATFYQALSQSFLSLALGGGVFITYGAYLSDQTNLPKTALAVVGSDTLIAFLAGLIIFPLIFSQGITPTQGPKLVFISLPQVFQTLGPLIGRFVGGGFFLLMLLAAMTSTISMLEIPVNYYMAYAGLPRKRATAYLISAIALLSIPNILSFGGNTPCTHLIHGYSFMQLLMKGIDFSMPLIAGLFCLHVRKRWERSELSQALVLGSSSPTWLITYCRFSIKFLAPILIGIIIGYPLFS